MIFSIIEAIMYHSKGLTPNAKQKSKLASKDLYRTVKKMQYMDIFKITRMLIMARFFMILMKGSKLWLLQIRSICTLIFLSFMSFLKFWERAVLAKYTKLNFYLQEKL